MSKELNWSSNLSEIYKGKKLPKSITLLEEVGIKTLFDVSRIFPSKFYPVKKNPSPDDCFDNDYIRVIGNLKNIKMRPIFRKRMRFFQASGQIKTEKGIFSIIWFNLYPNMKEKINNHFTNQDTVTLEGNISLNGPWTQIVNPTFKFKDDDTVLTYPTVNKVKGSFIEKIIKKIPRNLWDEVPEIDNQTTTLSHSLISLHQIEKVKFDPSYLNRIKYEEFFIDQVKIKLRKENKKIKHYKKIKFSIKDISSLVEKLPYSLTEDQEKCMDDIFEDLNNGYAISRLVQGDVGCGKTTIAILSMLAMNLKGYQVAFMAPTENLAYQHLQNVRSYFNEKKIAYLTSALSIKERNQVYKKIESGELDVIVGTHSLFQEKVVYKNLGFCIIDEQHKFGVDQRIKLLKKCSIPHCLLMTATPIPRTLRLTQYGDLDLSLIKQMPSHKKGYKTRIVKDENLSKYYNFLRTRFDLDEQAYIVLPNIEKTEHRNTFSIEEVYQKYKDLYPDISIGILHGKMDSQEQRNTIDQFRDNSIQLLISTTVVEVGIHVSNATLMIIYHPEYFGLSSLHQLRGRVGRDKKQGFCFLLITNKLSQHQNERLVFFEDTNDGFKISEQDLLYRGEGNLFGKTQSGLGSNNKLSNIVNDLSIFNQVIEDFKNHKKSLKFNKHIDFYKLNEDQYIKNLI